VPRSISYLIVIVLFFFSLVTGAPAQEAISGFTEHSAGTERQAEQIFQSHLSADQVQEFHRWLTAEPHPAGSDRNNQLGFDMADIWKKQGMEDVQVHRYDVLVSSPRELSLEMVSPVRFKASLREDPYDVDPDTKNPRVSPGYTSLSQSGEVTAPVIYAHSGNPEDYALLKKHGIDVRGKIVLVRYSNPYSYRGFKALTAQKMGAAAILIYSDPMEDGYVKGKVFPDGPWGPASHIQRGAITYDFLVPGDPLTPGWASVPGARHIPMDQARSLPRIMALPLSWKDAKPLLQHMGGPIAPKSWQGGLPIKYRLGGHAVVHLKIDMDTSVKPNYVIEARIRGSEFPDQWVVLGNHRDAWVFGGVDPSSGTASMLEMTRSLGNLLKAGYRPRRTLVFCSWDGEEVGLTGSTEWGEQFADELKKNMVAYLNVDSSASGPNFLVSAVASLSPMLVELSKDLPDPSGKSLYSAWKASTAVDQKKKVSAITDHDLVDTKIGSGSDHTVFLNYLGKPTAGLSFDGPYGVYHSMYDDYYWINHIGDPGYKYHTLMSSYWGTLGLRLANADLIPFDFASYASDLRSFVKIVEKKPGTAKQVDLKPLYAAINELEEAAKKVNAARDQDLDKDLARKLPLDKINGLIMDFESNWLDPNGIPGRPWFKHLLYAARYTYAHLELPGLTEAVEAGNWKLANAQAALLTQAVNKNVALLKEIDQELRATAVEPPQALGKR